MCESVQQLRSDSGSDLAARDRFRDEDSDSVYSLCQVVGPKLAVESVSLLQPDT